MRCYDDVVEVRAGGQGAGPQQFMWRGRLYVVRDVLSHWYERTAWWDGALARTLLSGSDPSDGSVRSTGSGCSGGTSGAGEAAGAERELWRVEASPGRAAGSGVFDLAVTASGASGTTAWRLVRALD